MNIQTLSNTARVTFSPLEYALATGLSQSTVQRRLNAGEIRSVKLGRRRLIPRAELDRLTAPQEAVG